MSGRLLDFGAGVQPYRSLFGSVASYVAIDVPGGYHALPTETVLYDGCSIPLRSAAFDWVLATEVLEHVKDPQAVLTSLADSLCPGGRLALSVPFVHPVHEPPNDYRRWTHFGLVAELESAGFTSVTVLPLGGWHTTVAHLLRVYAASCRTPRLRRWIRVRIIWLVSELITRSSVPVLDDMCTGWFVVASKPAQSVGA